MPKHSSTHITVTYWLIALHFDASRLGITVNHICCDIGTAEQWNAYPLSVITNTFTNPPVALVVLSQSLPLLNSLSRSLNHLVAQALNHSITYSLTRPVPQCPTQPRTHLLIHSCTHRAIITHSLTHSLTRSHSLTHVFTHSATRAPAFQDTQHCSTTQTHFGVL